MQVEIKPPLVVSVKHKSKGRDAEEARIAPNGQATRESRMMKVVADNKYHKAM